MTRQDKQPWGAGGSSGKRIPDSEDKPVTIEKGMLTGLGRAARALKPLGAEGKVANAGIKALGRHPGIGVKPGLITRRTSAHFLGAENTALKAAVKSPAWGTLPVTKGLPSSAMAHMVPKSAAPVKTAMAQGGKSGMSLKPMKAMKPQVAKAFPKKIRLEKLPQGVRGHFSGRKYGTHQKDDLGQDLVTAVFRGPRRTEGGNVKIIRKAARYHDPEAQRQRRVGAAEGITGGAGLALGYKDIRAKGSKGSGFNRGAERQVMVRGKKWGTVKPIKSVRITPRLGAAGALMGAAYGIDRYANGTAGRRYR